MPKKQPDNLSNLLQVKNITETSADLYIYGDIVSSWWDSWESTDVYPDIIKNFLDSAKNKALNIYINSGGGSVFAGMAIYNMLKRHNGLKTVYVDGLAASIASVIALAGDKLVIPSNAYFMIHKPWSWTIGDANEIRRMADSLDVIEQGIIAVYADNLADGVDIETIKQMVQNETWLTGEQAAKYFNVEVTQAVQAVAYAGEIAFAKLPETLKPKPSNHVAKQRAKLNILKLKGAEHND
jgi:ATP-dependent Clp protease protease subunit